MGDEVEVVSADNPVCVVAADARVDDGTWFVCQGKI
jgi:hypothetical protein